MNTHPLREAATVPANVTTVVNESLARGLRQRAIPVYRDMAAKYEAVMGEAIMSAQYGKWTAKRAKALAQLLRERAAKRALATYSMLTPNTHWMVAFAPRVNGDVLTVDLIRFEINGRRRPGIPRTLVALRLSPHALERMFQRLRSMTLEPVQEELHTGLMLALPLRVAAMNMGLRQIGIPTAGGTFLCEADGKHPLLARTWLMNTDPNRGVGTPPRWEKVTRALRATINAYVAEDPETRKYELQAAALGAGDGDSDYAMGTLVPRLTATLEAFPWLKEPYGEREDRIGTAWAAARAQETADAALAEEPERIVVNG